MNTKTISAALTCALIAGCSSSSSDAPIQKLESQDVSINFAAEANDVAIECGTQLSAGEPAANFSIKDFRFYVHNVALLDGEGNRYPLSLEQNQWQQDKVALLDFTNKADSCAGDAKDTRKVVAGSVAAPAGTTLNRLEFTLGLPNNLNHKDRATASAPLNIQGLHWNWQNGYKFARLDVLPDGGISRPSDSNFNGTSWNFHLGSTNCSGSAQTGEQVTCARPNRPVISLANFDHGTNSVTLDYAELVKSSNLSQDIGGAPGCMSGSTDPECAAIFSALGMNVTTGEMDSSNTQTVFSVQ